MEQATRLARDGHRVWQTNSQDTTLFALAKADFLPFRHWSKEADFVGNRLLSYDENRSGMKDSQVDEFQA